VDGKVQLRDLLSMILWWASQKLLVIEEKSSGKFLIRRICAMPAGRMSFEKTLWNALFYESECVDLSEPNIEFSMALKQAKRGLIKGYNKNIETSLYTKESIYATIICSFITMASLIAFIVDAVHANISIVSGITFKDFSDIVVVIFIVSGFFNVATFKFRSGKSIVIGLPAKDGSASTQIRVDLIFLIPFVIMIIVGIISGISLDLPKMIAATISIAICMFFTVNARKRTESYGNILGRVLGFKKFLKVANVEQMEKLFANDPQYYFKILPFAWVFGLSNIWSDKFKIIIAEPPDAYMEYNDNDMYTSYMFIDELDRF
jgi:hypothetical protein